MDCNDNLAGILFLALAFACGSGTKTRHAVLLEEVLKQQLADFTYSLARMKSHQRVLPNDWLKVTQIIWEVDDAALIRSEAPSS